MTVEPRVEDLLASIRKAIDDDLSGLDSGRSSSISGNSQGTLMRGALREMRVSYGDDRNDKEHADQEIAHLRERISRSRTESAFAVPAPPPPPPPQQPPAAKIPPPKRGAVAQILSGEARPPTLQLRNTIVPEAPIEDVYYEPPAYQEPYPEEIWDEEPQPQALAEPEPYYEPVYPPPVAPTSLVSPQTAYSAQASFQHLADSIMARATGDRGIEDMTRDLLRGMLKQWLDDHLPDVVERLVREEIERVARRGR